MSILDRAKEAANLTFEHGQQQVAAVRQRRQRSTLITELGEATYRQATGEPGTPDEIDRLVAELTTLDESADVGEVDLTKSTTPAVSANEAPPADTSSWTRSARTRWIAGAGNTAAPSPTPPAEATRSRP